MSDAQGPITCCRGVSFPTSASSAASHTGVSWLQTGEGEVVEKSRAEELREAGALPDPGEILLVRALAQGSPWTVKLTIQFTTRPVVTRSFPFEPAPERLNEDGYFSAAFVFVTGEEQLPEGFGFPLLHVIDVSEPNEIGHAPRVDVSAEGAAPVPIKLGEAPAGPPPELVLECVCIPGVTFDFDSSFLRPSVLEHMQQVDAALTEHPDARLFVVGHTDRVGDETYNKKLSDRRALSTFCFITDDADGWESLYQEEAWGLKVVQTILKDLGHDPGVVDGLIGPNTRAAFRSFLGVPANALVENNASFRRQLFLAYMTGKHDVQAGPERFMPPRFTGCGEFNPVVPPNAAELANAAPGNEPNRRVVLYLVREDLPAPCAVGDLAPCKAELAKGGGRFGCAFYDSIATRCACEG